MNFSVARRKWRVYIPLTEALVADAADMQRDQPTEDGSSDVLQRVEILSPGQRLRQEFWLILKMGLRFRFSELPGSLTS